MQTVIIVVHLMIVLALIGLVLLQRPKAAGLAWAVGGGFMTTRGTDQYADAHDRDPGRVFFVTSLVLSILAGIDRKPTSILNTGAPAGAPSAPARRRSGPAAAACSINCSAAAGAAAGGPAGAAVADNLTKGRETGPSDL